MRTIVTTAALLATFGLGAIGCEEQPPPTATPPPTTPKTTKPVTTKEPVKKLTAEQKVEKLKACWAAWDAQDEKKFKACYTKSATVTVMDQLPEMKAKGPDAIWAMHQPMKKAFPDGKNELGLILARGNDIVTLASSHGKNTGEMMGKPATNKDIGLLMAQHVRVDEQGRGLLESFWLDQTSLMGQVGLLPPESAKWARPAREPGKWGETKVVIAKNDKTEKDNLKLYREGLKAFNDHKVDDMMAMYADDAVMINAGMPKDYKGKEEIKKSLEEFFKMSTDAKARSMWAWAAGDYVASAIQSRGTHDGPSADGKVKPSNKKWSLNELEIVMFEGGKIKEHWFFNNSYKWAVDTGMAPPPEEPKNEAKKGPNAPPDGPPAKPPTK